MGAGRSPRQYNKCIYGSCRSTLGSAHIIMGLGSTPQHFYKYSYGKLFASAASCIYFSTEDRTTCLNLFTLFLPCLVLVYFLLYLIYWTTSKYRCRPPCHYFSGIRLDTYWIRVDLRTHVALFGRKDAAIAGTLWWGAFHVMMCSI